MKKRNTPGHPSLFTAEQLRDEGMQRAIDHADRKAPSWGDKCFALLVEYLTITSGQFLTEYFRPWAESIKGLPAPPNPSAYGPVMKRAINAGIIRFCGYARTSSPQAHKRPASVWIRTPCMDVDYSCPPPEIKIFPPSVNESDIFPNEKKK